MFKNLLKKRQQLLMFSFMLPALIMLFTFVIWPVLWGLYISFTNQALIGVNAKNFKFVGLNNYITLFRRGVFVASLLRTLVFLIGSIIGQFLFGLGIALLITRKDISKIIRGALSTAMILPWAIPEMAAAFIWISVYEPSGGLLNLSLRGLRLPAYNWLFNWPMISVIVANIWKGSGFTFLLLYAALENVPFELYEAAEIDGASRWKKFISITLPLIKDQVVLNLMLITLWTSMVFTIIFVMTGGGPFLKTTTASIFIYHRAFTSFKLGLGSAASVIMLIINLLFAFFYIKLSQTRRRSMNG